MSSKADDFDVRYRDTGLAARPRGGYRGNPGDIDYDLRYGALNWETEDFVGRNLGATPKRTSQGNQVWPYVLWGASICILLFSGYVVYRSTHTIGPVASSSSVNQRGDGLITALAE